MSIRAIGEWRWGGLPLLAPPRTPDGFYVPHPFQSKQKGPALSDKIIRCQDDVCSHIIFITAALSALPAGTVFLPCCPSVFPRPSHYSVITSHWQVPLPAAAAGAGVRDRSALDPRLCLKSAERTSARCVTLTQHKIYSEVGHTSSPREMEHRITLQSTPLAWNIYLWWKIFLQCLPFRVNYDRNMKLEVNSWFSML